ncbi:phosphoribosylformylglycinamidine synthase subunit PurL [Methanobrevibacter millerae]|uniref:Phosphoribosylformylglycinamidine synthase subunit PurL n=1 Tax=Methanobrevibacter millerae TaxID=230361 RepID=A0A1G5W1R4_9EURY|nr:phosphoribosylformylglycinamidine synthase subunit PurL [Methanobrevibacter millerae]SDA52033.1 phosphoribosylformylglycinamidine synthase [Methanobrevibacter millerae]
MTLADSEIEYIEGILGRKMNELEEGMLDVMFSEHCSYKSSRPFLRAFPTEGENIILGPGDDAGLVSVTDKYALAVGMESHNHPSAIEPYGGAGTGIGGILRDIISMGAMPIALLDSLRFGPMEDEKSRYLFEHVVKGISDYGNRVGVPTVAGEIEFDESFRTNPLVNVMCVGLVEKENIVRAQAPNFGDVFLLMGGTTGRDGIHGVTFASEELTSDSETEDRPAVQVADPFTKKRVLEASLEILEKINVSGVKDLGGGGLTCCISELVDASNNAAFVDLQAIPLRETGMTPYEIMLSESQERMVFVINPDDVELAQQICDKHEIVSSVIGEVREGNNMIISDNGEEIANLPTILLADPPSIDRPLEEIPEDLEPVVVNHPPIKESLPKLLSSPNIASKSWVYRQYDHEVQIRTVVKPGDDAAVLRIDDNTAIALTTDSNTIHTKLSPFDGAAGCVAEAIRNVVSMGATPYAVVDCLNFGNPEKPDILWQFKTAIEGMSLVAEKFDAPVISGNVSFYNETEGIKINPTPAVGVIGVENIENIRTMDFKNEGDKIILIGKTYDELTGSEYHRTIHNLEKGIAPRIRIDDEVANAKTVLNLLDDDKDKDITAIHDVSAGGLAVALSEMAMSSDLGCEVELTSDELDENQLLYSESHGRYLVTVKNDKLDEILSKMDVPVTVIGEVKGDVLKINDNEFTIDELRNSYTGVIEKYMA